MRDTNSQSDNRATNSAEVLIKGTLNLTLLTSKLVFTQGFKFEECSKIWVHDFFNK